MRALRYVKVRLIPNPAFTITCVVLSAGPARVRRATLPPPIFCCTTNAMAEMIAIEGSMPSGASKHASSCLGIYKKRTEFSTCAFVAGRPTYAEFYGKDRYLWFAPASKHWLIGTLEALGTEMGCIFVPDDQAMTPDEITGRWWAIKPNSKLFVPAPDVRLYTRSDQRRLLLRRCRRRVDRERGHARAAQRRGKAQRDRPRLGQLDEAAK